MWWPVPGRLPGPGVGAGILLVPGLCYIPLWDMTQGVSGLTFFLISDWDRAWNRASLSSCCIFCCLIFSSRALGGGDQRSLGSCQGPP